MGDRVTVKIIIPTLFQSEFEAAIGDCLEDEKDFGNQISECGVPLECYVFHEIDEGILEFESDLKTLKIPHSIFWDGGSGFEAGESHFRINSNNEVQWRKFGAGKAGVIDFIEVVKANADGSLQKLLNDHEESYGVISWFDQVNFLKG